MEILNRSLYKLKQLRPLVKFVTDRVECSHMALLKLYSMRGRAGISGGYAWQYDPERKHVNPSLVRIQLSSGNVYPLTDTHVPEIGPITFWSFEEEFVFVLAHELRHIDQFWGVVPGIHDSNCEQDAEQYALKVLKQYRNQSTAKAA